MAKTIKIVQEEPLEKKLWAAADKLRKNMDASEYKHVALGLIFLKYISDAFEELFQKLTAEKSEGADPEDKNESYLRVWTKPVTGYAKNYSKFDISLSPIKNTMFNRMKSQLKVIEAGFYKKAIIASNIGPYTIDLKHCLDNGNFVDGNAILVNEARNHADWSKFIEKLVKNPNLIKDMGERLYETVKDKYDLNNVTNDRKQFYIDIANKS